MHPLEWKYPATLIAERARVAKEGSLRERVRFDLEGRPAYAFGLLAAADAAKFAGIRKIIAIEFGVATGEGLLELSRLSELVTNETGIEIDVVGFDNGVGLPAPKDHRDHPEIWAAGDFAMGSPERLQAVLPQNSRLILGDLAETIGLFSASCPDDVSIGFCIFDLDIFTSTQAALEIYAGPPSRYLPTGTAYFDDTLGGPQSFGSLLRNRKCGQLLAIEEFNARYPARCIDSIRILKYRRPMSQEQWLEQVYGVHILDHPLRNVPRRDYALTMQQHGTADWIQWPI
jgi:hypothetical protein